MKYLVLFAVLFIAYLVWRSNRVHDRGAAPRRGPDPAARPQEMVACACCGVHLPKSDAVIGSTGLPFCSQEHRLRGGS
jgi:uncharacterized protein